MNWTGGQLQRNSKNAVKGTLQKQKQHFARVRTQLQNGTKSGSVPFCPSFLYETEGEIGNCLQSFGSFRHKTHGEGYRAAERTEKEDVQRGKRMRSRHESVTESTQKELPEGSHYLIDVQEAVSATSHGHSKRSPLDSPYLSWSDRPQLAYRALRQIKSNKAHKASASS